MALVAICTFLYRAIFVSTLLLPALALALQVEFTVMDKLGKPVDGASICLQEDAGQCTQTNAQGKSTFSPTVGLGGKAEAARAPSPRLKLRAGDLSIVALSAGPARLARYNQYGRLLEPARTLALQAGENRVTGMLPAEAGISIFVLEAEGQRHALAAVSLPGVNSGVTMAPWETRPAALAALGKSATANLHAMVISKSGFQTVTYRPRGETEAGVLIRLSVNGDSAIRYTGVIRAKVTGLDTVAHSLGYAYSEHKCTGATAASSEQTASLPLWIKDGKWYFPAGNCQGVVLAKPGVGMFGLWKTVGVENLPAGLFPFTCDPIRDSAVTSVLNLFFLSEGGGWDIDLRADSMTLMINRNLCPGNQLVQNPAAFDGQAGRPLLTQNSCRQVDFRNAQDEPSRYAFPITDSLRAVFTYGSKTCTSPGVALTLETTAPKTCPETPPTSLMADTVWQNCVRTSGFVQ